MLIGLKTSRLLKGVGRCAMLGLILSLVWPAGAETNLLNVSYDVSREFYKEFNAAFIKHWRGQTGQGVVINQSHGGSSSQAQAVIAGLQADVVTMNQATDIDAIAETRLISQGWRSRFPNNSAPYTSTIVFLVRKGNPRGIKEWEDLVRPGVQVIIPNPKTSGNGRYSYLAAWGYALRKWGREDRARGFIARLFRNVPILDTGGRGATTTFIERGIGDVLLTFENEVFLIAHYLRPEGFTVVTPSISIEAEAPVAVVDKVVETKGTRKVAEAYLGYLWSDEGQRLAAKHHFRPRSSAVLAENAALFPAIEQLTVDEIAGGWPQAQKKHFADGGLFDQIYPPGR